MYSVWFIEGVTEGKRTRTTKLRLGDMQSSTPLTYCLNCFFFFKRIWKAPADDMAQFVLYKASVRPEEDLPLKGPCWKFMPVELVRNTEITSVLCRRLSQSVTDFFWRSLACFLFRGGNPIILFTRQEHVNLREKTKWRTRRVRNTFTGISGAHVEKASLSDFCCCGRITRRPTWYSDRKQDGRKSPFWLLRRWQRHRNGRPWTRWRSLGDACRGSFSLNDTRKDATF